MNIKQIDRKIERTKEQFKKLVAARKKALTSERIRRKQATKYKIGDIITYGHLWDEAKERPLLITQVEFSPNGTAWSYNGFQIIGGKLSRVWGSTGYWHESIRLVGAAANLLFFTDDMLAKLKKP